MALINVISGLNVPLLTTARVLERTRLAARTGGRPLLVAKRADLFQATYPYQNAFLLHRYYH